jgi:hypothetical protein
MQLLMLPVWLWDAMVYWLSDLYVFAWILCLAVSP